MLNSISLAGVQLGFQQSILASPPVRTFLCLTSDCIEVICSHFIDFVAFCTRSSISNMHLTSSRFVLLVCSCLVLLKEVKSFSLIRHVVRNCEILAAKSTIPSETIGGYTFAERVVNNVTLTTGGNSTGKPKRTVVSKNPRDWTPYEFRDADGEYDVPFINEAMW